VSVSDAVLNQGAGAAGTSTTRFYLSTNLSIDANDVALSPGRVVPALGAGASDSGPSAITIPASTTPGNYYVLAKADGDSEVAEGQESNNVAARMVQVKAGS
jgi:subtilase family serine protease